MNRISRADIPRWFAPLVLFVLSLACFIPSASNYYANWDAYASSLSAWRIATTGHPWMEGVNFSELTGLRDPSVWQSEINGHLVTTRMFGPILVAVPFYWVNSVGNETDFSIYRGGVAASVLVAAAVAFLFMACRSRVGDRSALVGAAVFGFTTPIWSVAANALWTHPMTVFGLAGAAWAASRDRWWLAGIFLGVGIWARPHVALVAAILGLGVAWSRRRPLVAVQVGVPTVLSMSGLGAWNNYVFGTWSPLGVYADHRVTTVVSDLDEQINQFENVAGFLISPDRGFLVWTPIVLLLLPAVIRARRQFPDWAQWLALGGIAYIILQLGLNYYGGADGFYGYRHGLELLVCVTPLYILAVPAMGWWARLLTPIVVAMQFAMIAPGAIFETFYVSAYDVWHDNSYWYALRNYPLTIGTFTAICLVAGAFISSRVIRREPGGPRLGQQDAGRVVTSLRYK